MPRLPPIALSIAALLALASNACASDEQTVAATAASATTFALSTPAPVVTYRGAEVVLDLTTPTPVPTESPTPVPIHHAGPFTVVIDAGHGGPPYTGGSALDSDGNKWWEKDLNLDVALRLSDLLAAAGYNVVLTQDGDYALADTDPWNHRPGQIADLQARVGIANEARADVLLSVHFNGWPDASLAGTETYCNPDRDFAAESCVLAGFVQDALVRRIREAGYDVRDRGVRNDADVGGDPANPHSYLLGTNANFSPSLMPGIIAEVLFLSNPSDLAFTQRPEAIDVIAGALKEGIDGYFAWLTGASQ